MTNEQLYVLGMISAENARIEAMKAANQHRLSLGHSIAYDEDAFCGCSSALEQLAIRILNSQG